MFKRLKHFEVPDDTVLLVKFHRLGWQKVVTYVYIRVAQRVGGGCQEPQLINYTTDM